MNATTKKSTGSYYTCNSIADYIAKWAVGTSDSCLLEPSFGDGVFIKSAVSRFSELGNDSPSIIGIEMQAEPYNLCMNENKKITGFCMDFLDYRKTAKINAIIGNPPYVSLKNLKKDEKKKSLNLIHSYGVDMQTSASLWMPFVIHATELLELNGKLGFVLPYEITYVRYAFELWKYLSRNYGKIRICRIFYDFFPNVDVETIVFLAEEKGSSTNVVEYDVFGTTADLFENKSIHSSQISINDIVSLQKPFERELMPKSIADCLDLLRRQKKISKFVHDCKFKIGYVSGNKTFFHPSRENIAQFGIRQENVRKSLLNAKQLSANIEAGLETAGSSEYSAFFYPVNIAGGEKKYIEYGESQGINNGYKCRARNPWYLTPCLEIPDVVLTVFGDVPKLLLNSGQFYVSNSLLGGFSKVKSSKELICRWYNSLTLLSIERSIHSLGGGTLVLIPGETDKLEIVADFPQERIESTFEKLTNFAKKNKSDALYKYGDDIVLKEIYRLSDETIENIRTALSLLRNWRNPEKRREKTMLSPTRVG